jgi:exonuclease III
MFHLTIALVLTCSYLAPLVGPGLALQYASITNEPTYNHEAQSLKVNWHRPEGKLILLLFFINLLLIAGDVHPNPGPVGNDKLTCFFLNAQSIKTVDKNRSKLDEFRQLVETSQADIFIVNESWLQPYIPDSLFVDEKKYAVYRKDRETGQGGGVIILVSKTIWSRPRYNWESQDTNNNEIRVAEVRPTPSEKIAVITAYRPQTNPCPKFLNNLEIAITNCLAHNIDKFIMVGDFNYPEIKWNTFLDTHLSKNSRELIEFLEQNELTQFNKHPSRKGERNILDLFITNLTDTLPINRGSFQYSSDHYVFDCTFMIDINRTFPKNRTVLNYKRADFESIKRGIRQRITLRPNIEDTETAWAILKATLTTLTHQYIPTVTIKNKYSPSWIDADVIKMSHKKKCAYNKWKKSGKNTDQDKYKILRNKIKNLVSTKYKLHMESITTNLVSNPKRFWTLLKDRTRSKTSPSMLVHQGKEESDPKQLCEIFNTYFSSVFNSKNYDTLPEISIETDPDLKEVTISEEEVSIELTKVNTTKAPGPDGLSTRVLKECREELKAPITKLFNSSLNTGKIPKDWKKANVVPIYKKGNKLEVSNYRPVSLLPIISKILERCVLNKIIELIRPKISKMQYGFMKGKSTTTQIITVLANIHNIFDNREKTDVIYFDLAKAFDSVPHKLLLHKLKSFGIHGKLLNWITDYLTDRMQRVTCEGQNSTWLPVTSGVPQGSILGPILFIIYINDLPDILSPETLCAIFADDTKIYRKIEEEEDIETLQTDINKISEWGSTWGLNFNAAKTTHLPICPSNSIESHYSMEDSPIRQEDLMNDLGINIATNLRWSKHTDIIVKKAHQRLGLIIRTLGYDAPLQAKKNAYVAMVRSILEYGSSIWTPSDKETLRKIEKIQRKATNFIVNNPYITKPNYKTYKERLLEINLLPLSYRREISDLTLLCKSMAFNTSLNIWDYISLNTRESGARTRQVTQAQTFKIPKTKTSQSANFYPVRVARLWNSLPLTLRETLRHQNNSTIIKQHLIPLYKLELANLFDPESPCTWIHTCNCTRCRMV